MKKLRKGAASSTERIHVEEYAGSIPKDAKILSTMFHLKKSLSEMAKMLYGSTESSYKSKVHRELQKAIKSYPALFGTVKPPEKVNDIEFHVMINGALTNYTHSKLESAIQEAQKLVGEQHVSAVILRAVGVVKPTDIVITETTLSVGASDKDEFLGI